MKKKEVQKSSKGRDSFLGNIERCEEIKVSFY